MDNKILLQNLAEAFAARTDMPKRKAETFVRAFFELAEEGLTADSILKIKGFATFKIVTVSERESVNINTGERFQISGHEKISFLPDNIFKELVNRPFNHFTTITLDDDFDVAELDDIPGLDEDESAEDLDESTETPEEDTGIAEESDDTLENVIDESENENGENAETESETSEESRETATVEPVSVVVEPISDDVAQETPAEAAQNLTEEAEQLMDEAENMQQLYGTEEHSTATEETETTEASETSAVSEEAGAAVEDDSPEASEAPTAKTDGAADHSQIVIHNTLPSERHNWWRTAFTVLVTLVLMALSYFVGYYHLLCPCIVEDVFPDHKTATVAETPATAATEAKATPETTAKTATAAESRTNATATQAEQSAKATESAAEPKKPSEEAQKPAAEKPTPTAKPETAPKEADKKAIIAQQRAAALKAASRYRQMENGEYLITGITTRHTMDKGDNLYKLARDYYGDKKLAKYIIFHNRIDNPDIVQLGQTVEIPRLSPKK